MTKDERLFKRALDVLDWAHDVFGLEEEGIATKTALRERLAQPEQCQYPECKCATENPCLKGLAQPEQEPVACIGTNGELMWLNKPRVIYSKPQPLFTTPPQRTWVGLTDEEIKTLPQWFPSHENAAVMPLIRAFEAKLREKNT